MKAKKIVLNRSLLSSSDVADLEYEAKAKDFLFLASFKRSNQQ